MTLGCNKSLDQREEAEEKRKKQHFAYIECYLHNYNPNYNHTQQIIITLNYVACHALALFQVDRRCLFQHIEALGLRSKSRVLKT